MNRREILESAFTILAVLALWPVILGWEHPVYSLLLGVILVIFIVLVINKFRRVKHMYNESKVEAKNRPPGPPDPRDMFGGGN
jgi:hypothetical protein